MKTRSIDPAFWHHLERFGTEKNIWKQGLLSLHSDNIWNNLELQRIFDNKVSKACILALFETIFNLRENCESNVSEACILTLFKVIWNFKEKKSLKLVLRHYLKRFGTAEKFLKTRSLKPTFWQYLKILHPNFFS